MKVLLILFALTAVLFGCNAVTEPAPEDPLVPAGLIQLVEKTYKNPQNMVFTEILSNRIWNLKLESQAKRYSIMLSPDNIKAAYRLMATDVPDSLKSLLDKSVITGGTFSDFMEEEFISFSDLSYEKTYLANYLWKGKPYLLKWGAAARGGQKMAYDIEMSPVLFKFPTAELSDLPQALQRYFQGKGFQFTRAAIFTDPQSKRFYQVWLHKNNSDFQLIFDQDGKLIAGSDQPVRVDDTGEMPDKVRAYINSASENNDFGFKVKIAGMSRSELDNVKSYVVILQPLNATADKTDTWHIVLDQNANLLMSTYYCTLN